MRKYIFILSAFILVCMISGCNATSSSSQEKMQVIEADIILSDAVSLNQECIFKVHVTQGSSNVDDAQDVQFEIWNATTQDSEMLQADFTGNGTYTVSKQFSKDGIYYVQTHVNARGLHVMPKKQLIVGKVSEEEINALREEPVKKSNHQGHHH
ncbi:FixH family protein [Peribacillus sp. JNUCC 23]